MNKAQLIDAIAAESKLSKTDSKKALDAFLTVVADALKKGDKVTVVGFGSFSVNKRNERNGRNPKTKEPIVIPARNIVKFKAGTELEDNVQEQS